MRALRIVMIVIVALCLLPFVSLAISLGLADLGACQLDEGSVHPCLIAGVDLGAALYAMSVVAWVGIVAVPLLMAALLLWGGIELVRRLRA
jgi:hypothetical protein